MPGRPTPPPRRADPPPRLFAVQRTEDTTGLSGTGLVCWGVRWPNGRVSMWWRGDRLNVYQVCHFDSTADLLKVHGHGGRTTLVWLTADPDTAPQLLDTAAHRAAFRTWEKTAAEPGLRRYEVADRLMPTLGALLDGYDHLAAAYRRQAEELARLRAEADAQQEALDVIAELT